MPQLKRTLVAWGTNESGLATLILRLLSHMAKIFPSKDGDADGAVYQVTLVGVYFKGPVQ